jgi:hypothetical protein
MFWPTPYPVTTTLAIGGADGARIVLPVIPPSRRSAPQFKPLAKDPSLPGYATVEPGNFNGSAEIRNIEYDEVTGDAFTIATNQISYRYPWGLSHFNERVEYRTCELNPAKSSFNSNYALVEELKDRKIRLEQDTVFNSDLENFYMTIIRRLKVNDKTMHEKQWDETIPRDFQ